MNERTRTVIAIDGPAASGKSSTASGVARRLGRVHLNSGLLYRAYTWATIRAGRDHGANDYASWIADIDVRFERDEEGVDVVVDGERPGRALHGQEVARRVSAVAAIGVVRAAVLDRLREAAAEHELVCDGRDIGTTVFPEAELKIFLVADAEERARRRLMDLGLDTDPERVDEEAARLQQRDAADAGREISPLRRAEDAVDIDTTRLELPEVIDRVVELAKERGISSVEES